jgi:WhiB family redox-sensing transcriptional regulator
MMQELGLALFGDGDTPDWTGALCAQVDGDLWFPEKGGSTREAKRICAGCDLRAACLEYALKRDDRFGVWGGLSEAERRRLRRGEKQTTDPAPPPPNRTVLARRAEIARLTGLGLTAQEIAATMNLHVRTVVRNRSAMAASEAVA